MRFDHHKSLQLSAGIFLVLLLMGSWLSVHKTLWLDEFYLQKESIDRKNYVDILTFQIPEDNKCPLFYLVQKSISDLFSYHLPVKEIKGLKVIYDQRSQIIMRLAPNVYMSLGLTLIFYFFLRYFSLLTAIFALAVALVSPMIWLYWAEARPYGLWFLLTSAQLVLYCSMFISSNKKPFNQLLVIHVLLALTTPASLFQILIISLLCYANKWCSKIQMFYSGDLVLAQLIFCYWISPLIKIKTYLFSLNLFDAIMPERLFVYALYILMLLVYPRKNKENIRNSFFLVVFLLFLIAGISILYWDLFTPDSQHGFYSRYLIFLTPADILMFTFACIDFYRVFCKNIWIWMNVAIVLGGLVILRGLLTYREILATALFLHSPG